MAPDLTAQLAALADENRAPSEEVIAAVSSSGDGVRALKTLSRSPDPRVRLWAALYAGDLAKGRAGSLLVQLAADRDPDVRDAALQSLVAGGWGPPDFDIADIARRKLFSKDPIEPITAMWLLAATDSRTAVAAIREFAASPTRPWHLPTAEVVSMLLDHRDNEVLERLSAHDHDRTSELATAAVLMHTPSSLAVLLANSTHLPDTVCRDWCKYAAEILWSEPYYQSLARLRAASVGQLGRTEHERSAVERR